MSKRSLNCITQSSAHLLHVSCNKKLAAGNLTELRTCFLSALLWWMMLLALNRQNSSVYVAPIVGDPFSFKSGLEVNTPSPMIFVYSIPKPKLSVASRRSRSKDTEKLPRRPCVWNDQPSPSHNQSLDKRIQPYPTPSKPRYAPTNTRNYDLKIGTDNGDWTL